MSTSEWVSWAFIVFVCLFLLLLFTWLVRRSIFRLRYRGSDMCAHCSHERADHRDGKGMCRSFSCPCGRFRSRD